MLTEQTLKETYLYNNEGDPFAYRSNWPKSNTYQEEQINNTEFSLGKTGQSGGSRAKYDVEIKEANSTSSGDGGYFGMSLMAGGGGIIAEAWVGAAISFEESVTSGISVAKAKTETCEGCVAHISPDLDKDYDFKWTFGTWKMNFGAGGSDVLCLGYGVTGQKAPIKPVTDLKGTYLEENGSRKIRFTFTEPVTGEKRTKIDHYNIYQVLDDEEKCVATVGQ